MYIPSVRQRIRLPGDRFKMAGDYPDPFFARSSVRWQWMRLRDRDAHRRYVGATAGTEDDFRSACTFQLDFMVKQGLKPEHTFLDLGCGCLRAGIHFIPYLEPGNYLGMDISAEVIRRGVVHELGLDLFESHRPEFVVSESFEFHAFSKKPDFILANSLYTHLPAVAVSDSLEKLARFVGDGPAVFYATFREVDEGAQHGGAGHYEGGRQHMTYTRAQMAKLGTDAGWTATYIGPWGHPKNDWDDPLFKHQMMMRFSIGE